MSMKTTYFKITPLPLSTVMFLKQLKKMFSHLELAAELRINIELSLEDDDGDPLDAYCQFVYWTVENYPQGHSAESGLLELLEEATRVLKDDRDGIWRKEIRYLKLWLLYASYVEKPTIIYKFLIANDIGTEHALLYEEYAAVLERDRRRKEADAAYALGIARKAEPLGHLESCSCHNQIHFPRAIFIFVTDSYDIRARPPASSVPSPSPNGRMQIFVDPTGAESQEAASSSNTWTDIGTRKTRIKENVRRNASICFDPKKSKDVAVPQTPSKSGFAIFTDAATIEEFMISSTPKFTPFRMGSGASQDPVIKVKKAGLKAPLPSSEAEALRKDPLKNYGPEAAIPAGDDG
ncbi:Mad3/BUB1 homology region 1-domain-containing protein [Cyathus striatus]|nr:Mad3/BUB1 homology region 1-domain-containing protein [Cyathus striatus]